MPRSVSKRSSEDAEKGIMQVIYDYQKDEDVRSQSVYNSVMEKVFISREKRRVFYRTIYHFEKNFYVLISRFRYLNGIGVT